MKLIVLLATCLAVAMASLPRALDEFTSGNLQFTARLYTEILKEKPEENFVFSPLSAEIILALTRAGAKGQTERELQTALYLPNQQRTEEALRKLLPALKSNKDDLKLLSANKMYLGEKFEILPSFQQIATSIYDAGSQNVNFNNPEEAAGTINQWVEEQTDHKIQNLISPRILAGGTRLVLVNALYLNAKWETPFENTYKEKFFTSQFQSKEVDMMHIEDSFRYYECAKSNAKFLELPYRGNDISMTIVLPNEKEGLSFLEANIEDVLSPKDYEFERVAVSLPRWTVESDLPLKPILKRMGLITIFSDSADLSGISKKERLMVDNVIQKAFINVTESETEAAAASAVIGVLAAHFDEEPYIFRADHPFCYFIKYKSIVLFGGKINE